MFDFSVAFYPHKGAYATITIFKLNPLSADPTKWSNTLKLFACKLPPNYVSVFDHFVKLALKGLRALTYKSLEQCIATI